MYKISEYFFHIKEISIKKKERSSSTTHKLKKYISNLISQTMFLTHDLITSCNQHNFILRNTTKYYDVL